ncbi:hypothetical protein [Neorhizobium vignae]|uniref:hypothetical protein n=1 Tax=Neorhizobium vignae TaxID=690585 RepID=UPI00056860DD|nr:hypothetical protein [Neorhizobium vignae]
MRVEDGRTYVDKEEVARRLIHSSIRNILKRDCALTTHLILGSATTLLQEYAKSIGKGVLIDIDKLVRPEFAKGMKDAMNSHYNFFKHANFDAGLSIDVTNISQSNELEAFRAIVEYWALFEPRTHQMSLYFSVITILYPDLYRWELLENEKPSTARIRQELAAYGKADTFRLAAKALDLHPFLEEIQEDKQQIYRKAPPHYDGPPHRDMFKRKF